MVNIAVIGPHHAFDNFWRSFGKRITRCSVSRGFFEVGQFKYWHANSVDKLRGLHLQSRLRVGGSWNTEMQEAWEYAATRMRPVA